MLDEKCQHFGQGTKLKSCYVDRTEKGTDTSYHPSFFYSSCLWPHPCYSTCAAAFYLVAMLSHFPTRLMGGEGRRGHVRKVGEGQRLWLLWSKINLENICIYCTREEKKRSFYGYCPQLSNCGQLVLLTIRLLFVIRSLLTKYSAPTYITINVITSTSPFLKKVLHYGHDAWGLR